VEEPDLKFELETESEPEPKVTHWKQGRCGKMCGRTIYCMFLGSRSRMMPKPNNVRP